MNEATRWEYHTLKVRARGFLFSGVDPAEISRVLNTRGADGWELVSGLNDSRRGSSRHIVLILKRPKP